MMDDDSYDGKDSDAVFTSSSFSISSYLSTSSSSSNVRYIQHVVVIINQFYSSSCTHSVHSNRTTVSSCKAVDAYRSPSLSLSPTLSLPRSTTLSPSVLLHHQIISIRSLIMSSSSFFTKRPYSRYVVVVCT